MNCFFPFSRRRNVWFSCVLVAGASLLSACGGGSSGSPRPNPTSSPTPGATVIPTPANRAEFLVFAMAPDGNDSAQTEIFSALPDGSNLTRLTQTAPGAAGQIGAQGSPTLSPDRRQIVWAALSFGNGGSQSTLRIMNADGTNARPLSSDANLSGAQVPVWHPDGTRLAFSKGNDGIWTINSDGSGLRRLTDSGANPSWNRAGRIAFNAAPGVRTVTNQARSHTQRAVLPPTTGTYTDIWTMNADGSDLRQLTRQDQTEAGLASINPAWSADGQTLVFNSVPGSGIAAQLFLISADGANRRRLGDLEGIDAVWSPSGTRIAFSSEDGLTVANSDGTSAALVNSADALFVEDTDWR